MRTPAALTIIGLLIAATPAQADLALLPPDSSPATRAAGPSQPGAAAAPAATNQLSTPRKPRSAHLHDPVTPKARGFGSHIPLSFAVRQIVPSPIKVSYGRSANQAALVDWQGGRNGPACCATRSARWPSSQNSQDQCPHRPIILDPIRADRGDPKRSHSMEAPCPILAP